MGKSVTIGNLADRGVIALGDGYRTKRSELGQFGYRILRVADLHDWSVRLEGEDYVRPEFGRNIGSKCAQMGDVLLTTKGTVGRVAVMPLLDEEVVYSPQLCFFRVQDLEALNPRYLAYWLKSTDFVRQLEDRSSSTDMAPYISLRDLRSIEISLPTTARQDGIAEVLGALDDKIAANDQVISSADALARALTSAALGSDCVPLENLAELTMGSSPPGDSYNVAGDGVPFYQGVRDFSIRFPVQRVWTTEPIRMARRGDTLLSVRAPVGRTNMADEDLCMGRGLAGLRSRTGHSMVLFHLLQTASDVWSPFDSQGTVFGSINKKELAKVKVPTIAEPDLPGLEAGLTVLEKGIAVATRESRVLARTRDELLPLLMSGKLTIADAERRASEVL